MRHKKNSFIRIVQNVLLQCVRKPRSVIASERSERSNPIEIASSGFCRPRNDGFWATCLGRSVKGFTLIEVLLALFITAILITILSVIFNTGLRAYRQGRDLLDITRKAQFILGQMTREISGAMVQAGRISFEINNSGDSDTIYFMSPIENTSDLDLCEIGYSLADRDGDGVLDLRRHYSNYGTGAFEYPGSLADYGTWDKTGTFCNNVTQLNFRYRLAGDTSWTEGTWTSNTRIPEMLEIQVRIEGQYGNPGQRQYKDFTTWVYIPNCTVNP